jgi:hypothetical protein
MNNNKDKNSKDKAFHLIMPRETWLLIKKAAVVNDCSMGDVVVHCVEKHRKKLTDNFNDIGDIELS